MNCEHNLYRENFIKLHKFESITKISEELNLIQSIGTIFKNKLFLDIEYYLS